jgi:hypothetical protein
LQIVSALEYARSNDAHLYAGSDDKATQVGLRTDKRIQRMERAWKRNDSVRRDKAQILKASGTIVDKLSKAERLELSKFYLTEKAATAKHGLVNNLRDRAMMAASCVTAFRGDNLRHIQLSDLQYQDIPVPELDIDVPCLVILSANGKTNREGRIDSNGSFRHKHVHSCAVGAIAFYLFAEDHIIHRPRPSFAAEFSTAGYGVYGRRAWYERYLFIAKHPDKPMVYDSKCIPLA